MHNNLMSKHQEWPDFFFFVNFEYMSSKNLTVFVNAYYIICYYIYFNH